MIDEVTDVAALQQALKEEIAKRIQLEDECDLLAVENVRLNEEVAQLKSKLHGSIQHIVPLAGESDRVSTAVVWTSDGGDEDYPNTETMCIMNACNGKNVLSVSFCYNGDDEIEKIAAGGADNSLNIYDLTGSKISTYVLSAPVLSIDSYGEYLACSLMDGAHAVVNLTLPVEEGVQRFKDHSKHAVCIRWSPDGQLLAVASVDKSLSLYKRSFEGTLEKVSTLHYAVNVESIAFVPAAILDDVLSAVTSTSSASVGISLPMRDQDGESAGIETARVVTSEHEPSPVKTAVADSDSADEGGLKVGGYATTWDLIIGMRDAPHLVYLRCDTMQQRNVSLNDREWDTHSSFVPLHLAPSPDFKYLLVATDKDYHVVYITGANRRVLMFAEHSCGEYGRPKVSWDATGKYIYSNSATDNSVIIYSMASQRSVGRLIGHSGSVRDVVCSKFGRRQVVTGSFDKSLRVWGL